MGKAVDLSEFDRGQIVTARRLGTSITETARLVGCKWINDGDTSSRRQDVGRPRVIKEKRRRRLSRLVKQNRLQTVAQLTAQYNASPSAKCFGTHSSADIVGYGTVQQMSHSCASVDQASS
ncbi:hypothetical protein AVEN_42112-1 [Araneus ventricosus]|uniref:Uncharacterized protein n=1 Tax=Araneus ventricosus TaxID=182803 RepID=A0A4Y2D2D8_ARAVE|nr:hypothetical protein AVEN_42112-1 [Araneus ventricosus]